MSKYNPLNVKPSKKRHLWRQSPLLHILFLKKRRDKLIKTLRVFPIAPMSTPINNHSFRVSRIMALIYQVYNSHWAFGREASAPCARNNENFGLIIAMAKGRSNTVPPIEGRVIGHQLAIPYGIAFQGSGKEEGLV